MRRVASATRLRNVLRHPMSATREETAEVPVNATTEPAAPDRPVRTSVAWVDALGAAFVRSRRALQLATGIFLVLLGLHIGSVRIALMLDGTRSTGRIVAYEQRLMPTSGTSTHRTLAFMPVVEFQTGARTVRFTDWLGSSGATALHESVPIIYRRADPSVAMIDRPLGNWLPWAPVLALGLMLSLDAVRGFLARRRASRTPHP